MDDLDCKSEAFKDLRNQHSDQESLLKEQIEALQANRKTNTEEIESLRQALADKDKEIADKDKEIADKDKEIADKDKEIGDKTKSLAESSEEIEVLKVTLAQK